MKLVPQFPALLILAAGTGAYACNVYNSSLTHRGSGGAGGSGASGGSAGATGGAGGAAGSSGAAGTSQVPESEWGSGVGWWSKKTADGCISASVPTPADRPNVTGGASIGDVVMAVRSMALGSLDRNGNGADAGVKEAWKDLGFDLDNRCNGSDTCPSSKDAVPCKSPALVPSDGNECRDNTFGRLENTTVSLPSLGPALGLSNNGFNCALCRGDYNFLVKISEWNGKPDDDQVRIDLYPSPGLETPPAWKCPQDYLDDSWKQNGCWSPGDAWTVTPDAFAGTLTGNTLPPANLYDAAAYVRSGYIVARLPPNALFWFPGDNGVTRAFPVKMQGGIVAGKLVQGDAGDWQLTDGTIAGRAKIVDLIDAFEQLGLCPGNQTFDLANGYVNNFADLLSTGANSPSAACDAISVGIGFEAAQAAFNGTVRSVKPLPGCPSDGGAGASGDAGLDASGGGAGTDASLDGGAGAGGTSGTAGQSAMDGGD